MTIESSSNEKTDESLNIVRELGELPPGAIVEEEALARMFGRCSTSIKRAVDRGEFPHPIRILGKPSWTVRAILDHINNRLEVAQREAEEEADRLDRYSP